MRIAPTLPVAADSGPLQFVNPLQSDDWDERLDGVSGASLFYHSPWARVLHATYGFAPRYMISGTGAHATILPLMEIDSWLTGRRGVALPFTDECEPVTHDAASFQTILQAILDYGRSRRWRYFELRGGRRFFATAPSSVHFVGHALDLTRGHAALLAGLSKSTHWAARKAERDGVAVEFSTTPEAIREFYTLVRHTRKRQGMPPQPAAFFTNVHRFLLAPGHGFVGLARWRNIPVAGAVFLHHGSTSYFKFGASDYAYQHLRANNALMWRAIERLEQQGFAVLDFGRTSLGNEGLRHFKLGWGTTERMVEYFRYDFRASALVSVQDRSRGWHNRVFRLLPGAIGRIAGAALYRHVG